MNKQRAGALGGRCVFVSDCRHAAPTPFSRGTCGHCAGCTTLSTSAVRLLAAAAAAPLLTLRARRSGSRPNRRRRRPPRCRRRPAPAAPVAWHPPWPPESSPARRAAERFLLPSPPRLPAQTPQARRPACQLGPPSRACLVPCQASQPPSRGSGAGADRADPQEAMGRGSARQPCVGPDDLAVSGRRLPSYLLPALRSAYLQRAVAVSAACAAACD